MSRSYFDSHGGRSAGHSTPSGNDLQLPPPYSPNALPRVTDSFVQDRTALDRTSHPYDSRLRCLQDTHQLPPVSQLLSSFPHSSAYPSSPLPAPHSRQGTYDDDGPRGSFSHSRSGSMSTFPAPPNEEVQGYAALQTRRMPSVNPMDTSRRNDRSHRSQGRQNSYGTNSLPSRDASWSPGKESKSSSAHGSNDISDSASSHSARQAVLPQVIEERYVEGEGWCYVYADGTHCPKLIDGEPVNANWGITKAGKPRKRLAQACITCREKKIKCHPNLPKCDQCQKSGRECRFESPEAIRLPSNVRRTNIKGR